MNIEQHVLTLSRSLVLHETLVIDNGRKHTYSYRVFRLGETDFFVVEREQYGAVAFKKWPVMKSLEGVTFKINADKQEKIQFLLG